MKRLIIALILTVSFYTLLFSEEAKQPPEVCVRLMASDSVISIMCIDGYAWFMIIHSGGAYASQIKEMKDGKEVFKTCKCNNTL